MATASADMTTKLATDYLAIGKELAGFQTFLKAADDSPSAKEIATQQASFDKIKEQIVSFAGGLKLKPPIFPGEDAYKERRKDVTALAASVAKTAKAVEIEKKAIAAEITVKAVSAAKGELLGKDKALAQALAMVARGEKGRSGPKEPGIDLYSHIHIGGNAMKNLLFQPSGKLVLGVLDFHLEKGLDKGKLEKIKKVAARGGGTIMVKVSGDTVSEK